MSANQDLVKSIADALLEYETITKEQIDYLVEHGKMPEVDSLEDYTITELRSKAKEKGIKGYSKMTKEELIDSLGENE